MAEHAHPPRGLLAPVTVAVPPGVVPEDDPRRGELRAWLAAHPDPSADALADAGLVAPAWPPPWGRGADALEQLLIDDELERAGVTRPANPIGLGWAGPTILEAGTEEQKQRWLPGILRGTEIWCQLFSEPDAGSDLSSLQTRAVRDGDEWVISGQKVWTTYAHLSRWGILLARTGEPPGRISYFICPMDAPGVEVRALPDMTGLHAFNEVFLHEVRLPADHLLGAEGDGWRLAKVTLANERTALSGEGVLWGRGPTAADLVGVVRRLGLTPAPVLRDRLVQAWIHGEVLRLLRLAMLHDAVAGHAPGPEASLRKALADDHGQEVMNLAEDLAGTAGVLAGRGPGGLDGDAGDEWAFGFLYAPALTIGGGTFDVQRNIIAERILGLPPEPRPR